MNGIERIRHLLDMPDDDVAGQLMIHGLADVVLGELYVFRIEMSNLRLGVDARIGAGRPGQRNRMP